jgi:hypothetical protein
LARRRAFGALALSAAIAVATLAATTPTAATTTSPGPRALPLYRFAQTGTGALPWTAESLAKVDGGATLIAGPVAATSLATNVLAFITADHAVALIEMANGQSSYLALGDELGLPPTTEPPEPFFDALGRLNVAYVDAAGQLLLVTNDPDPALGALPRGDQLLHQSWVETDLSSTAALVGDATGTVAATTVGADALLAVRTTTDQLVALTVPDVRPFAVTVTTAIAPTVAVATSPVLLGPATLGRPTLAATTATGIVDVFAPTASGGWATTNLRTLIAAPTIAGPLAATSTGGAIYLAGASVGSGDAELDTYDDATSTWSSANLTKKTAGLATPGPALTGTLAVTATGAAVTVAGAAAGWGNLFAYSDTGPKGAWTDVDVSATGGSAARSVSGGVAALDPAGSVTYFALGVNRPAPPGVGIYDIPYGDLPHAVSDGWPILADTGGLGTQSAPYVQVPQGTTTAALAAAIKESEDYQVGAAIAASHERVTWLSFWTVSGPSQLQTADPSTYRANAYAAGAAVASTIDQYAADGLGLKPDWVILDPEGYPDDHSQLNGFDVASAVGNGKVITVTTNSPTALATGDTITLADTGVANLSVENAPITVTSARTFTLLSTVKAKETGSGLVIESALFVSNWNATIAGWRAGIASVDPTLNAALYVDQSEYGSAGLAATEMPIFVAIAWGTGDNAPVAIAHSSNVLGFIEFGNVCVSGKVQAQLDMFKSEPWNGQYNTVQFTPPGYCTPTTP